MVILYQIAIFTIIILSSFLGFGGLFIAVSLIIGFSLTNIFTLQLMVLQFTTIIVATVIGIIIAGIKLLINMPKIIDNKINSTINYFKINGVPNGRYLKQYLLRCCWRFIGTFIISSLILLSEEWFGIESSSPLIGAMVAVWIVSMIVPLAKINERDGGFINDSSNIRNAR